jgi:predicted DNA-binding transcriptional regulator YafY
MKFSEYYEKIDLLKKLIDAGNTGNRQHLSRYLKVSERTLARMIEHLRQKDKTIYFDRKGNTYLRK